MHTLISDLRDMMRVICVNEKCDIKRTHNLNISIKQKCNDNLTKTQWKDLVIDYANRPTFKKISSQIIKNNDRFLCIGSNHQHPQFLRSFYSSCTSWVNFGSIDEMTHALIVNYNYLLIRMCAWSQVSDKWIGGQGLALELYNLMKSTGHGVDIPADNESERRYKQNWKNKMNVLFHLTSLYLDFPALIHCKANINTTNNNRKVPTIPKLRQLLINVSRLEETKKNDIEQQYPLVVKAANGIRHELSELSTI